MTTLPFELWLEFENWQPVATDNPRNDFFNMIITMPDGSRYSLNVWTFDYFSTAIEQCRISGEHLHGTYLPAPDIFVEELKRTTIERIVTDLIANHGLKREWLDTQEDDQN